MHRLPVQEARPNHGCDMGCSSCGEGPETAAPPGALTGVSLVASSAFFFLVPIALGIAASVLAGPSDVARFLSGAGAFLAGMVLTSLIARRIRPQA